MQDPGDGVPRPRRQAGADGMYDCGTGEEHPLEMNGEL
jgi:hypothetical protein